MTHALWRWQNIQRKQLILTILNSTATKRETKNYFLKYQPRGDFEDCKARWNIQKPTQTVGPLRISLIKIRGIDTISDDVMLGIGNTVTQMVKLGVSPIFVIDESKKGPFQEVRRKLHSQYSRLSQAIERAVMRGDDSIEKNSDNENSSSNSVENTGFQPLYENPPIRTIPVKTVFEVDSQNGVHLTFQQSILDYLHQGNIPVVHPIGYSVKTSDQVILPSNLVVENLAVNLHHYSKNAVKNSMYNQNMLFNDRSVLSIEKIIYIDPLGGIPSLERMSSAHVLINLKQEFNDICDELDKGFLRPKEKQIHLSNLHSINNLLTQLPDSAGAIIISPKMAAIGDTLEDHHVEDVPVATDNQMDKSVVIADTYKETYSYKKQIEQSFINQKGESIASFKVKNPIIYNILTDRPLISPSLPVYLRNTPLIDSTIVRKGIEVNFAVSTSFEDGLDLVQMEKNGKLNLAKVKELIDDSFRRSLDLDGYLKRINGSVAGLIWAGDYEAGAIITWEKMETPDGFKYVPYLDKFAVKRSVQGTFSAADIVFKMMVNTLFPKEIMWRSRQNNPVNKWYHERSSGSMAVPDSQWRCFWAGRSTKETADNLKGYMEICKRIVPNWIE